MVQILVWRARVHLSIVSLSLCLVLSCRARVAFVWIVNRWNYFDLLELAHCFEMRIFVSSVSTRCLARISLFLRPVVRNAVVGDKCFSRISMLVYSSMLCRWSLSWNTWINRLFDRVQLSVSLHLLATSLRVVIAAELCRFVNLFLRVESLWNACSLSRVAYFLYSA